jgi:transcriptional antiterminator RfaH
MTAIPLLTASPRMTVSQPWFVVQVKPNADAIAKRNLLRQGIQIFAPFEEATTRKVRSFIRTKKALFPGYFFVSFDQEVIRWRTVNSTFGVSRIVSFSKDQPAQVPLDLISDLMLRCDHTGRLLPSQLLQIGDNVCITNGPLSEFIGSIEQIESDRRIWILLDIIGKNTRVALRAADLRLED